MPLDVLRLRDSTLAASATDAEFRCAVTLWCASWHQVPAGSLPDDDRVLCLLAGLGRGEAALIEWRTHREGALRGFVTANDGLLYHPTIAEKALEAWARKQEAGENREANRRRLAAWREAKAQKYKENSGVTVTKPLRNADVTVTSPLRNADVTSLTGRGTGTGTKEKKDSRASLDATEGVSPYSDAFESWWKLYPRPVGKRAAFGAYERAARSIRTTGEANPHDALKAALRAALEGWKGKDDRYIPHAATWLNQGRYDDPPQADLPRRPGGRDGFGVGG